MSSATGCAKRAGSRQYRHPARRELLEIPAGRIDHDELIEIVYLPLDKAMRMAKLGENEDSKTIIALLIAGK
jgi:hypothetical protein